MQDAFFYVLIGTVAVGLVAAIAGLLMSGKAYQEIGKGGFFTDSDGPAVPEGVLDIGERDDEIRQMLEARNARHAARGGEIVDVEEELARLTAGSARRIDPALRAEIRELVVARNARLIRRGKEPLDVDAEVERQVRELGGT